MCFERARLQPCRKGHKNSRALAPEGHRVKMQGCRQSAGKASRKESLKGHRFSDATKKVREGHDFSRAVTAAKIDGASAPEVSPPTAGILRDYMPDSNEMFVG